MLSGLDTRPGELGGPLARRGHRTLAVLAGGLLVVAAAATVGWWQWTTGDAPSDEVAVSAATPRAVHPETPVGATTSAPALTSAPAAAEMPVASAPALIETMPTPPAGTARMETAAPAPEVAEPPSVATTALGMQPASAPVAALASRPNVAPSASSHQTAPAYAAARPAATPHRTAAAPTRRDSDVDLLAAIVTHLEGETRPPAASRPARPKAAQPPGMRASTLERMVRSCKQFADAEEVQCRRQVCEGSWGRVAACPAKLAPKGGRASRG